MSTLPPSPPAANVPLEYFEELARDQRRTIHNSVSKLRVATKERLDVRRNLAHYFWPAAAVASLVRTVRRLQLHGHVHRPLTSVDRPPTPV